jgi:hypothetical protein
MRRIRRILFRLLKGVLLLWLIISAVCWVGGYFCTLWVYLGPRWPGHGLDFEIRPGRFVVGTTVAPELVRGDGVLGGG